LRGGRRLAASRPGKNEADQGLAVALQADNRPGVCGVADVVHDDVEAFVEEQSEQDLFGVLLIQHREGHAAEVGERTLHRHTCPERDNRCGVR